MITLNFIRNRTNSESFAIKIDKKLSASPKDFVVAEKHGIEKVELKGVGLVLSSDNDEISFKNIPVYYERQTFEATEFTVKLTQASKDKIDDILTMELVVNEAERIAFVDIVITE